MAVNRVGPATVQGVGQRSVLVVDDDNDIRELVAEVLRHAGYAVTTAGDGPTALRAMDECAPDVILLDLVMPHGGGEAFLRSYRLSEQAVLAGEGTGAPGTKRPTIVAFTALVDGTERAAALGVEHTIPKPFHVPQLLRDVARWAGSA
jgi:CheY-like chemotaxis protein